jgi:hypothetical protein
MVRRRWIETPEQLSDMDSKFFDSLFEGDSANGVKLGMGLTGGDFWPRASGCQNLYRGESASAIDFDTILAVSEVDGDLIAVPAFVEHKSGASYVYVLRRVNRCGNEEWTLGAAVKVAFDDDGNLVGLMCNDIFAVTARQIEGPKVRLVWYYCNIGQGVNCGGFNVYWDNSNGVIDYENKLGAVNYVGPRYYRFETDALSEGRFQFCVRAESECGEETECLDATEIQIRGVAPQNVEMLQTQTI